MSLWQSASTGVVCRGGGWAFRAAGQRAVRGSLVSAGLGPRVVLCGAHDSLRLVLGEVRCGVAWRRLGTGLARVTFSVPRRSRCQGLRALCALAACGRLRALTAALRRDRDGPGQSRPFLERHMTFSYFF